MTPGTAVRAASDMPKAYGKVREGSPQTATGTLGPPSAPADSATAEEQP